MDKSVSDDSQSVSGSETGSVGSSNTRPRRLGRGRARCLPSDSQEKVRRPGAETLKLVNGKTSESAELPAAESPSSSEAPPPPTPPEQPAVVEEVAKMSSLRVNAVEFVPRTFSLPPPASPVRQNLNQDPPPPPPQQQQPAPPPPPPPPPPRQQSSFAALNSTSAPPPVSSTNSSGAAPPSMPRRRRISSNSYQFNDNVAIDYLEETLKKLVLNPGSFVELVTPLVEVLNGWIDDNETLSLIVDVIFHQAVSEANFHWTGAKLCCHLAQHLTVDHDGGGNFRQHLLKRCHEEHKMRVSFLRTNEGKKRLHGFAFFLAELFISMEVGSPNGGTQRIHVLRKAIVELLQSLFGDPSEENMKTIVKVLKLAGAVLEDCERSERPDGLASEMDNIVTIIKGSARQHTWSKNARDMMYSVVELRASNWGRTEVVPSTSAVSESTTNGYGVSMVPNAYAYGALIQSGPVFFTAEGEQITAQEAGYMSELDYIQQLHWGNEGTGDSNYQNYRNGGGSGGGGGRGRGRGAVAGESGGFSGTQPGGQAIVGQAQGGFNDAASYNNYNGFDGVDPYAAAGTTDMWSTNDEMTDDMIEAFEKFIIENNMGVPTANHLSGPNGYGNGH